MVNKEKKAARNIAYYAKNRDKILARTAAYYIKNKDKIVARQVAYQAKNKDKIAAYRFKNKDKKAAYSAVYRTENKEKIAAYYAENKDRYAAHQAIYRAENKDEIIARRAAFKAKLKLEVFKKYSNGSMKCMKCGFGDLRALSIDHINGGGRKHLREIGVSGNSFYRWLKANNFPKGFQVLCMNCQFIKSHDLHEARQPASHALPRSLEAGEVMAKSTMYSLGGCT